MRKERRDIVTRTNEMPQSSTDSLTNNCQLLATTHSHPRDARITFEEKTHCYTVDGIRDGWTSCTKFIHSFFPEFDADAVIAKMMASSKWCEGESPYFGMTVSQIKKQWSDKAKASSEAGTNLHLQIERFYNNNCDDVQGIEWSYFMDFHTRYATEQRGFVPYRTEWLVFDTDTKISGSIDMVYYIPADGTYAIYDWKRASDIKTENKFQSGNDPISHLPDTNYWHYSLQLNIYRYILQKNYGIVVSELALVILHPANSSWKVMKLNFMDDEVADMMATRC